MAPINVSVEKHLEFVQSVVARMANNSFLVKGWSITVVLGATLLAGDRGDPGLALLGLLPAISFWGLDAYYLRQERLFRRLHDEVRLGRVVDFDLSTAVVRRYVSSWPATLCAPSLAAVHGMLVLWVLGVALYLQCVV